MSYKVMPKDLYERYAADPLGTDAEVRRRLQVPEDKYYSVSVWPDELAGRLFLTAKPNRTVKAEKISKSNQPQ